MNKKIWLLIISLFLFGCQAKPTQQEKQSLVNQLQSIIQKGEVTQLSTLTNASLKMNFNDNDVSKQAYFKAVFQDATFKLLNNEETDFLEIEAYVFDEVTDKATIVNNTLEGVDIRKTKDDEQQKQVKYLENIQKVKKSLQKKKYTFPVKFIKQDKVLKFDFKDDATRKILTPFFKSWNI